MAEKDIDKILRDIKKRKEAAVAEQPKPAPKQETVIEKAEEKPVVEQKPAVEQQQAEISEAGKRTLASFINNSLPEYRQEDSSYTQLDATAKKSEDYIDENFMNFFTSSVIVTKGPQQTEKPNIKRKKSSFLRRGYVTDSLSLNIEKLEEEEEKLTRKEKRRLAKEKAKAESASMPIVKTAGDVWAEKNIETGEETAAPRQPEPVKEKPVKEKKEKSFGFKKHPKEKGDKGIGYIFSHDEDDYEDFDDTEETPIIQPTVAEDKPVEAVKPVVETPPAPQQDEPVKVYTPKNPTGLNAILGDDKDPESLARRILRQRKARQAGTAVAVREKITTEIPADMPKEDKPPQAENKEPTIEIKRKSVPDENDGIINTIYTSIIEKQAEEALATEQMTGFIPEFEDEEEENTKPQPVEEKEEAEEEVFEGYISKSEFLDKNDEESRDIQSELMSFRRTLNMRIFLGFATGLILTYFNMAASSSLPMPAFIRPGPQPMMYALACTLVYAIAFIGFLPTVISGFKSLGDSPAPDSFLSLGAVLSLLQLAVMALTSEKTDMTKITVFGAFICIALAFNAMGKKIATNTILKNLTLADAPSGINAGYIVNDADRVKRLARTLDEKLPKVLVSRKTGVITNFVNAGFSIHSSDYTARKAALAGYGITAICFVMALVLSKNPAAAVYSAAGASALMIPLSHTLVNSVPSALMQKTLEKVGALVNGWQGIDQLSKTTHVNFDAKHLFPRGTVILHGIKTFEKERIDLAILYAASVLIKECEVLKPVFMEVIDGKTDILPKVDSCEYIELQGYVSWINDNRVIIGNRTLMEQYDVDMPPVSMENKFVNQGRKPVYLAVGGKLFGMFVFSYRPDEIVKENLERLMDKGVSVILSSKDFNIDPHLIRTVYGIPSDYVSVLNQREANLLAQFTDYAPGSECCVAHLDSLSSLVAGFRGAESAKSRESVCSIIQTISVAIGAVLALLFTYSQTIMSLPLLSVLLLSFGFMGIAMLTAVAKKYE